MTVRSFMVCTLVGIIIASPIAAGIIYGFGLGNAAASVVGTFCGFACAAVVSRWWHG